VNSPFKPFYEFGSFRIDAARRLLLQDGSPVVLTAKAFDLLLLLVERSGEVVSKEELMQALWPSTVVIDANLTQQVAMIRKALGTAGHRYIATHPGKGYSLVEPVRVVSPAAPDSSPGLEAAAQFEDRRKRLNDDWSSSTPDQVATADAHSLAWPALSVRIALGFILIVITALACVWWLRRPPSPDQSSAFSVPLQRSVLAVLPFQNLSNDAEQEYLSDGLTEETIADLGELSPQSLGVIARTSAMGYKHTSKSVTQIGNELRADYLLEGSVRREGATIRVTAQLIRVKDQSHLWAHSYDRELTGLLALQKEMGRAIAQQVRVKLAPAYTNSKSEGYVPNSEAYELFLQGLAHVAKRTHIEIRRGIDCLERASTRDPSFALAYAELASAYTADAVFDAQKAYPAAAAAAARALDLDDNLAEAHAALGAEKAAFEYDWPGAEFQFKRALELNPNSAQAHFQMSISYLTPLGQSADAIAEIRKALDLDPLSPIYNSVMGLTYLFARQYEEARAQLDKTVRQYPDFFIAHAHLIWLYTQLGEYPNAITELVKYRRLTSHDSPQQLAAYEITLRKDLASQGSHGFWLRIQKDMRSGPGGEEDPFDDAQVYGRLADVDNAMDALRRDYDGRSFFLTFINVDPAYDAIRSDMRFSSLVKRMGLLPKETQ
jgi:TolB-like protein/DNA-binding winged helix-turn-helix (wHTH) protein/Flp pilus assembly protein TadD